MHNENGIAYYVLLEPEDIVDEQQQAIGLFVSRTRNEMIRNFTGDFDEIATPVQQTIVKMKK